jgi:hypothetical protein
VIPWRNLRPFAPAGLGPLAVSFGGVDENLPGGRHSALRDHLLHARLVRFGPDAFGVSGREPLDVLFVINAFEDAVDPAEAERLLDRLTVGHAGLSGVLFEKDEPDLLL